MVYANSNICWRKTVNTVVQYKVLVTNTTLQCILYGSACIMRLHFNIKLLHRLLLANSDQADTDVC